MSFFSTILEKLGIGTHAAPEAPPVPDAVAPVDAPPAPTAISEVDVAAKLEALWRGDEEAGRERRQGAG